MINDIKEIVCDYCLMGIDYYSGSIIDAKKYAKNIGCIVKGNKVFCDIECYKQYKKNNCKSYK